MYVYGTIQRNVSANGAIPYAERKFLYQSERRIKENRQTVKEENDGRRVYCVARFADFRKGRKRENKKFSKNLREARIKRERPSLYSEGTKN